MLRWLFRLLIFGAIAAAIALAVSRFLNRDEDFDDFDDLEEGFEFQETPVEIDVPAAGTGGGEEMGAATATATATMARVETATEATESSGPAEPTEPAAPSGPPLTEVNGIGRGFAAKLNAVGVYTMQDLANANAQELSQRVDVIGGVNTIEDWISQAKQMTGAES